jgi:hypothetical protein
MFFRQSLLTVGASDQAPWNVVLTSPVSRVYSVHGLAS